MKRVRKMLKDCAPVHTLKPKKHRLWIGYEGKTERDFPLGPHGARRTEL